METRTLTLQQLARKYSALHYPSTLVSLLSSINQLEDFSKTSKFELHQKISDLIIGQYEGEIAFKYRLFNMYRNKKVVAAFEMKVDSSRADFIAVNGFSCSFEIKSKLDNLAKIVKQSSDYSKTFDYNYVIADSKHIPLLYRSVPAHTGIWAFKNGRKKIYRPAALNNNTDPEFQLRLLTKKERVEGFKHAGEIKTILGWFDKEQINSLFKQLLKARYASRWRFLTAHADAILPVDIQFFFQQNLHPAIVYGH